MSNREDGLYEKYTVYRNENGVQAAEPLTHWVFVLDPYNDPGAVEALDAYIEWCWDNGYDALALDLEAVLDT